MQNKLLHFYKTFALAIVIMLVLDVIWIKFNIRSYAAATKKVQGKPLEPKMGYVALSYMFMSIGLLLVLESVYSINSMSQRVLRTALWGFVIYGVYNSVNAAMFESYDMMVAIKDTLWGATLVSLSVNGAIALVNAIS